MDSVHFLNLLVTVKDHKVQISYTWNSIFKNDRRTASRADAALSIVSKKIKIWF